jgi:hypothetical protein
MTSLPVLTDLLMVAGWALRRQPRFAGIFLTRSRLPQVVYFLQTAAPHAADHG